MRVTSVKVSQKLWLRNSSISNAVSQEPPKFLANSRDVYIPRYVISKNFENFQYGSIDRPGSKFFGREITSGVRLPERKELRFLEYLKVGRKVSMVLNWELVEGVRGGSNLYLNGALSPLH